MTIAAPLGLLALGLLPAVVLLHRLHRPPGERRVAALFLFPPEAVVPAGGRRLTRLWRSASFWLECALVVLAALWLAGVDFGKTPPRRVVWLLDDSASMAATATRAQAASWLAHELSALRGDDLLTVIASGSPPQVLFGPGAEVATCDLARLDWRPSAPHHDLGPALALARELADDGELTLLSDRNARPEAVDVRRVAVGIRQANRAVLRLRREVEEVGARLHVTVAQYGDPEPVELGWREDDGPWQTATVRFEVDRESARVTLSLTTPAAVVHVRLPADGLAVDDEAFSLPPRVPTLLVHDELPAGLAADLQLDRLLPLLPAWRRAASPADAQLLLRAAPGSLADGQTELLLMPSEGARRGHLGPFVVDRSHPLLLGATFEGVAWQAGGTPVPGVALVSAAGQALIADARPPIGRRLRFDLAVGAGNVVRAPVWPILIANAFELARRDAPGASVREALVGQGVVGRAARAGAGVTAAAVDGEVLAQGRGRCTWIARRPGVVVVRGEQGHELDRVAVRFVDRHESDLMAQERGVGEWPAAPRPVQRVADIAAGAGRWWLLLLIAVALADWWLLARRSAS